MVHAQDRCDVSEGRKIQTRALIYITLSNKYMKAKINSQRRLDGGQLCASLLGGRLSFPFHRPIFMDMDGFNMGITLIKEANTDYMEGIREILVRLVGFAAPGK